MSYILRLRTHDGKHLGWVGILRGTGEYVDPAVVVDSRGQAMVFEKDPGYIYSPRNGGWPYLEPSYGGWVGFYKSVDARGWVLQPDRRLYSHYWGACLCTTPGTTRLKATDTSATALKVTEENAYTYTTKIEHVFLLMLENRSFDHMLGYSRIEGTDAEKGGPTKINGLDGTQFNMANGKKYTVQNTARRSMPADPGHEFMDVLHQLCGKNAKYENWTYPEPNNSGFADDFSRLGDPAEIMKAYNPAQIPALITLAKEFAVCDQWFSSMPGPTFPNRFFAHAASSGNLDRTPIPPEIFDWWKGNGFEFEHGTLFDKPTLDWNLYVHDKWANNASAMQGVSR